MEEKEVSILSKKITWTITLAAVEKMGRSGRDGGRENFESYHSGPERRW